MSGLISGSALLRAETGDCRLHISNGWEGQVEGRFLTRVTPGGAFPFRVEAAGPGGCLEVVRASLPRGAALPRAGERISVTAVWEGRGFPRPGEAEWAGRLRLGGEWEGRVGGGVPGLVLSVRGRVQERMVDLWGSEGAGVVEALVLARREHLDPELREAFGVTGTAHLLAISGFHVGVIAGILLGVLRWIGLRRRAAEVGSAAGCWGYVLSIGAPDAAVRAALLLTLLAGGRLRGRPVVPVGALGSALLLLLALNPGGLASVGFQLSFAGTAGLILLREPVAVGVARLRRAMTGGRGPGRGERGLSADLLRGADQGVTAGIAATLPTLPLLAWHFDRIALIGIPATLVVAPFVALAIPGIGASLLLSLVSLPMGRFVAGGPALLLDGVSAVVRAAAALPWTAPWVARGSLVAALTGGGALFAFLRHRFPGRVRPWVRAASAALAGATFLLLLPLLPLGSGVVEVHLIDVGQGDAVALRTPAGRWVLVDVGPRSATFDAGGRRVLPYLRRSGARRLEAVVLTHPHLDHIGGLPALLAGIPVRGILDPSRPHGSSPYLAVLDAAAASEASWWRGWEGEGFRIDGVDFRILHPDRETVEDPELDDPNDLSVVLLVRWGEANLLFTGDAPAEVERRILPHLPPLTLLKVGHHGSRTSTAPELLAATRPEVAIIGVGDPNGFGHPHALVLDRLLEAGVTVFRTDRDGNVRIRIDRTGSVRVEPRR